MGEGLIVEAERQGTSRTTRGVLAVGLIGLLVGGSTLLGGGSSAPYEDAGAYIGEFYASGDAAEFISTWDARFTSRFDDDRARLEQDITGILSQGAQVETTREIVVAGVPLVVVATSEGIEWCVRPDATVLPTCQLGDVAIAVDASALNARGDFSGGGMDLNRAEITFTVTSNLVEERSLDGKGELLGDTGPWALGAVVQQVGGQFFPPAEDGVLTLGGPFTLSVSLTADLAGAGQWSPRTLVWRLGGEDVLLHIPGPAYWLS